MLPFESRRQRSAFTTDNIITSLIALRVSLQLNEHKKHRSLFIISMSLHVEYAEHSTDDVCCVENQMLPRGELLIVSAEHWK